MQQAEGDKWWQWNSRWSRVELSRFIIIGEMSFKRQVSLFHLLRIQRMNECSSSQGQQPMNYVRTGRSLFFDSEPRRCRRQMNGRLSNVQSHHQCIIIISPTASITLWCKSSCGQTRRYLKQSWCIRQVRIAFIALDLSTMLSARQSSGCLVLLLVIAGSTSASRHSTFVAADNEERIGAHFFYWPQPFSRFLSPFNYPPPSHHHITPPDLGMY
jgi:hypothetical protein